MNSSEQLCENPREAAPATPDPPWQYAITDAMKQLRQRRPAPTAREINQAAGLGWGVYQTAAYLFTGDPTSLTLDDAGYVTEPQPGLAFKVIATPRRDRSLAPTYMLNVRDDLHQVVGVVKQRYRLFQNRDVPHVFDHLVEQGHADWVTAGLHRGGAEVWWLIRLHETIAIVGDPREAIELYLLLTHNHDGGKKTTLAILPLRVASHCVLAWPIKNAERTLTLKPTTSPTEQAASAAQILELAHTYQVELKRVAEQMITTPLDDRAFTTFLNHLLPTPRAVVRNGRVINQRGITMAENTKGTITTIYFNNPSIAHIRGTAWGAVQASQYYSDHHTINRNTDDATAEQNRFKRVASDRNLGAKAFQRALVFLQKP